MKSSLLMRQAIDAEGKTPHMPFEGNLEDPSARTVAASKYLSSQLKSNLPKWRDQGTSISISVSTE